MGIPIFFLPLRKPRTLWDCQPVVLINSFKVTPLGRRNRSRILAVLLPWRAVRKSSPLVRLGLGPSDVGAPFRHTGLLFRRCRRLFCLFLWNRSFHDYVCPFLAAVAALITLITPFALICKSLVDLGSTTATRPHLMLLPFRDDELNWITAAGGGRSSTSI